MSCTSLSKSQCGAMGEEGTDIRTFVRADGNSFVFYRTSSPSGRLVFNRDAVEVISAESRLSVQ